jgi:large subunit ribosomal protein L20
MVRVTNAPARKRRVNRLLKEAKGFWGDRKNHYANAKDALVRAWDHAYRGRKKKKGQFRALWIQRINAASRCHGISYSKLIAGLALAKIEINRKVLAQLAIDEPKAFEQIVEQAKKALA